MRPTRRALALWLAAAPFSRACAEPARVDVSLVEPFTEDVAARAPRRRLPYTALYERAGRRLVYVAARHAVGGATFAAVDRAFARNPNALVVEGFPSSWGESPERVAAVVRDAQPKAAGLYLSGEPGHALVLALARGIPFWGGEPDSAVVDAALMAQGFARADIAGVKMLQWLPQGRIAGEFTSNKDPRFAHFLDAAAARVAADFTPPIAYDRARYEAWHARQFGVVVYGDPEYAERLDPSREGPAAALSRAMTLARDRHIFAHIMRVLSRRSPTLVVYGGAHLATQARALEAALGAPRIV